MANYEITNPTSRIINLRAGPSVIYGIIASLASGRKGRGDFIMTYRQTLTVEETQRAQTGDQWMHVTELDGAPVEGWIAIRHLGKSYATYAEVSGTTLEVSFGVDLEGFQPIILTGTLKPK